ncbi:glycoside hydrolase family 113 [Actinoplanes sp. HUAS TT8]|uniref:glycoside hydrolase family 113 n=1 Tax=Actinoplanes sp. HUAS TT8 TaxID=3447453 RepID=UPI003F521B9F
MRHRTRAVASLLGALILLAACGSLAPHVPTGPQESVAASPGVSEILVSPSASAAGPSPTVTTAHTTKAELGVQIFWHEVTTPDQVRANADRLLDYVVSLGANSVGITFPIYTDGARPTRVYTGPGVTPTPSDLVTIIGRARARGLRVLVRPLIDEKNLNTGGAWRGSIKPVNVNAWFTSYGKVLMPFLTAAQSAGADSFVLGSELDSLVRYQRKWRTTVAEASRIFTGRLVYADNWGAWATGRPGVPGADPGLDAYPSLGLPDSATVAQLTTAWTKWLRSRPEGLDRTVIQEVGIAAAPGAYRRPTGWPSDRQKVTPQIQIRWFAGACAAAKSLNMAGIYFWTLDAWADPANAGGYNAGSFIGRGDQAIKECFASGWPR